MTWQGQNGSTHAARESLTRAAPLRVLPPPSLGMQCSTSYSQASHESYMTTCSSGRGQRTPGLTAIQGRFPLPYRTPTKPSRPAHRPVDLPPDPAPLKLASSARHLQRPGEGCRANMPYRGRITAIQDPSQQFARCLQTTSREAWGRSRETQDPGYECGTESESHAARLCTCVPSGDTRFPGATRAGTRKHAAAFALAGMCRISRQSWG